MKLLLLRLLRAGTEKKGGVKGAGRERSGWPGPVTADLAGPRVTAHRPAAKKAGGPRPAGGGARTLAGRWGLRVTCSHRVLEPRPIISGPAHSRKPTGLPWKHHSQTSAIGGNQVSGSSPQGDCPGISSKPFTYCPGNPFISVPSAAAL